MEFSTDHEGGMFGVFLLPQLPQDYAAGMKVDATRFARLFHGLLGRGVYVAPSQFEAGFVSGAHSEEDIAQTVEAVHMVFKTLNA